MVALIFIMKRGFCEMADKSVLLTEEGLKKLQEELEYLKGTKRLKDVEFDEVETYRIVGSTEADPDNGKISNESPVGMAVLGHNVGETVEVFVGENTILYEIMEIKQ